VNTWPQPGIHYGVPFATYRACDLNQSDTIETAASKCVSKSLITDFIEDPAKWKASPRKQVTKAMRAGSLFDCLATTPEEFESRYTVLPYNDLKTNAAKDWKAAAEADGIEVVKQDQIDAAQAQLRAVMNHPEAAKLLTQSQKQVACKHRTKYPFASKCLIDLVPEYSATLLGDLKTCEPSSLESMRSLQRHIFEWGYHIQAGAYLDGWNIATGEERTRFKFIFVTNSAPFRCAVIELPLAAILLGAQQYQSGIARFVDCLQRNEWPSQWDGVVELDLPEYAYTETP